MCSIECPALEELTVSQKVGFPGAIVYFDSVVDEVPYVFDLPWFIKRSECKLKKLAIDCELMSSQELAQTLSMLPDLTHLAIHNHYGRRGWKGLLTALMTEVTLWQTVENGHSWEWGVVKDDMIGVGDIRAMCPVLETIVFRDCTSYSEVNELDQLVCLFDARWKRWRSCLHSFAVIGCNVPEFDYQPEIISIRGSPEYQHPTWGIEI